MTRVALMVFVLITSTACAGANRATYTLGGGMLSGKAMLPATAKSQNLYYVRYREVGGGAISRAFLFAMSAPKNKEVRTVTDNCRRTSLGRITSSCTITTTIKTYEPSEAEIKAFVPFGRYLLNGALPVDLDIVGYSNGKDPKTESGNSAGGRFGLLFRFPVTTTGRTGMIDISTGMQYEYLTFQDVEYQITSMSAAGQLTTSAAVGDIRYQNFSIPIRISALIAPFAMAYVQYEPNLLGLGGNERGKLYTSPLRAGVQVSPGALKYLYGSVEAISDGGISKRLSVMAEVGIAY